MKSAFCSVVLASAFLVAPPVFAQNYPTKPVKILVGFPPGQASDVLARMVADHLQKEYQQPVTVENMPGAGGTTAVAAAAKSAPDGYTLVMTSAGPHSIAPSVYRKLSYDPVKDFTPVSLIATIPQFIYTNNNFRASTIRGLVDLAKKEPGTLSYASSGNGLPGHIIMESFKTEMGINISHIPYRGSTNALNSVIDGTTPIGIDTAAVVFPMYKAGKIRVLGVTSRRRTSIAPEVLSMIEQGYAKFDYSAWIGIVGPAHLPAPVTKKLAASMERILALPDVNAQITALGMNVASAQGAKFERWIQDELQHWTVATKQSGAQND